MFRILFFNSVTKCRNVPYDGLHDGIFQTPQSQKHTGVTRL